MPKSFSPFIKTSVRTKSLAPFVFSCFMLITAVIPANAYESTLADGSELSLFGVGIHQEKRNDIYIGALFAPADIEQANQLLDQSISKRMSLKFIAKYSNRQMARLWKQRIAMNNSKTSWRPMTKEIVQFAGLFKRPMKAGDEINIDFIPATGTSIYLNKTLFLTVKNNNFFELLLNIWIGSIPPNESFKKGINGNNSTDINDKLMSQFDSLATEIGRFDADKIEKPAVKIAKKPSAKTAKKTTNNKKKVPVKKPPVTVPTKSKAQTETDQVINDLKMDIAAPLTKVATEKPKIDKSELFATNLGAKSVPQKLTNSNTATKKKTVTEKVKQPAVEQNKVQEKKPAEKVAKLEVPEEEFFDADLFSGSYTQDLINTIRKYQSYPKKALAAGIEGEVTAQITIDKKGEILSNKIIQRSGSRILDRAVLRMIRKAEPFPQIPEELGIEEFEFDVPMNFTLSE